MLRDLLRQFRKSSNVSAPPKTIKIDYGTTMITGRFALHILSNICRTSVERKLQLVTMVCTCSEG